jgi:hypothetical protein
MFLKTDTFLKYTVSFFGCCAMGILLYAIVEHNLIGYIWKLF